MIERSDSPLDSTWPAGAPDSSRFLRSDLESDQRPDDESLPETIGRYRVLQRLGTGGMGEVFLAYDEGLSRNIALKRVRPDKRAEEEFRRRFEMEAHVTALLQHPSIIPIYHYERTESGAFYTMRPVEGRTLGELLDLLRDRSDAARDEWPTARIVRLFLQAANAVAYAHSRGVVHRDLKPSNIMIGPFEEVLVLDWGMAKLAGERLRESAGSALDGLDRLAADTASRTLVGTPAYMAPEQFRNHPADERTDLFSLGIILYELLALRHPWKGDTVAELLKAMEQPPERPTLLEPGRRIPQRLAGVTLRALAYRPEDRYEDVSRFAREVAQALEGRGTWQLRSESTALENWRLADGRLTSEKPETIHLRSRGERGSFRYFCTHRFTDSVRVEFDLSLRKGSSELAVWLNTRLDLEHAIRDGYCLPIVAGRRRTLSLLRSGRDVAGAKCPHYEAQRWYRITARREESRFSLLVDGEEIYAYTDPIPLTGGVLGFSGRSTGLRLRNLRVYALGADARVSCLAVPDAFFNRNHYEEARSEYERIAASHPGRLEGQLARFRSGLCMIEMYRREKDAEVRAMLLGEAQDAFTDGGAVDDSCLAALGRAIVAGEKGHYKEKHETLSEALLGHPDDPHLPTVHEWLLGWLHSLDGDSRLALAELLPLAISHCMENWGRGVVTDLVRGLRSNWETPSFMSGRARFRENDPVSHAEARLFFGFWSGRSRLVEDTFQELLRSRLLRPHHVSDTVFSLLELGQPEDASRVLEQVDRETPGDTPRDSRLEELCRAAVVGALGRLDEAFELIARSPLDPGDRASNSASLWVARALIDHEETSRAFTVLRPLGPRDSFAREQLAWFHLQQLDLRRAERHLKPFRERGDHRTGRNLSNFLEGASLMLRSRAEEAMEVFGCLPETRWPRTWTLGSHLATGRLGEGSPEVYLENAFPWERTTLASHQALLDRVRG